jgi:molybdenum cofactor sulfurtransferase
MIKPSIDEEQKLMRLEFPFARSVTIPLDGDDNESRDVTLCETKICGDRIQGVDCGDEVAEWLSDVLATEGLRLIRHTDNLERKNGAKSLSNQAQFLLVSEPSVRWLMSQVEQWDDSAAHVNAIVKRFRGNLVIDNIEPLTENDFKSIKIGKAKFEVQGPCTRCQMICIDQESGEKTTEPLRTIGKVFKGKMRFGIYLRHSNTEELLISCGDEVVLDDK